MTSLSAFQTQCSAVSLILCILTIVGCNVTAPRAPENAAHRTTESFERLVVAREIVKTGPGVYEVIDARTKFLPSDQKVEVLWRWQPDEGTFGSYVMRTEDGKSSSETLNITNGNAVLLEFDISNAAAGSRLFVERYVDNFQTDFKTILIIAPNSSTSAPISSNEIVFDAGTGLRDNGELINSGRRHFIEGEEAVFAVAVQGQDATTLSITLNDQPIFFRKRIGELYFAFLTIGRTEVPQTAVAQLSIVNQGVVREFTLRILPAGSRPPYE